MSQKHYVSRRNWTTHLPTLIQNAADGDTIVAYSDYQGGPGGTGKGADVPTEDPTVYNHQPYCHHA